MSTGHSKNNSNVEFIVLGEPVSKANSRKIAHIRGNIKVIKSEKALNYVKTFAPQCPALYPQMDGDVRVWITIYYASRRPDLDESVILDCMQAQRIKLPGGRVEYVGGIYLNDRQVKEKHIVWALDRENPRAHIRVEAIP